MQNQPTSQKLIKNLLSVAPKHCDNCGNKYGEEDFRVIKSSPINTVIHLKCKACTNAYMLNVINPQNGMVGAQRTPLNIDLTDGYEIQKFAGKDGIDRDEALDIYSELKSDTTVDFIQKLIKTDS